MQEEARPQPAAAAVDVGQRPVQCRRAGGAALGPAAADRLRDAVDDVIAAPLHQHEGDSGRELPDRESFWADRSDNYDCIALVER